MGANDPTSQSVLEKVSTEPTRKKKRSSTRRYSLPDQCDHYLANTTGPGTVATGLSVAVLRGCGSDFK